MPAKVEVAEIPPQAASAVPNTPSPRNSIKGVPAPSIISPSQLNPLFTIDIIDDVDETHSSVVRSLQQFVLFDTDLRENLPGDYTLPSFPELPTNARALKRYLEKLVIWFGPQVEQWNGWYEFTVLPEGYKQREEDYLASQRGLGAMAKRLFRRLIPSFLKSTAKVPIHYVSTEALALQVDSFGIYRTIVTQEAALHEAKDAVTQYLLDLCSENAAITEFVGKLDDVGTQRQGSWACPSRDALDGDKQMLMPVADLMKAQGHFELFCADTTELTAQIEICQQAFIRLASETLLEGIRDHLRDFTGAKHVLALRAKALIKLDGASASKRSAGSRLRQLELGSSSSNATALDEATRVFAEEMRRFDDELQAFYVTDLLVFERLTTFMERSRVLTNGLLSEYEQAKQKMLAKVRDLCVSYTTKHAGRHEPHVYSTSKTHLSYADVLAD